ncbi:conserved hypothetical protein [Novosphingobium aromaticivorans DSM 12444]|uniref:Anti-CBASS protein Acb1 n=1 Tax=Novosphingobium aromaticivorans (strain ATCC 700278 / DSM 12444 / CCUG 56034 / CIP 105152 / NBRC 16084 / F199) TaxID=279238 RepID=Q2G4R9_NOVAD|nr:anti-CBASS Acb1 family protein [Novosphingobium aromaticivorans]ABD27154.1 conserved hypothetical protein [Novosphingobium aromaticivorans DSM 12444]SCY89569.1 hypothetical protein SAMN05660666_03474 [Novosphingobium aromaticivorans]
MGTVTNILDSLRNALTGQGTSRDPRTASAYCATRALTQHEIHAAYSGSGLLKKIIQIPPLDMVREWRDWSGLDDDQAALIWDEEKRLGLREKAKLAETLRGLGGGAFILGLPGQPATPAPKAVAKGGLAYINVVSRWHLTFDALQDDARLPGYGEPQMWRMQTATGQQLIHPSRVVTFRADTSGSLIASMASQDDAYWGESRLEQVLEAVKDSDTARASFAALLHKARLTRIGIPNLSDIVSTSDGESRIGARLGMIALAESMYNAAVYDSGNGADGPAEKIDDVAYNFAGAKDVLNAFAEFAAAISDIPATRLLGRAPEGMNSSGDSQQKDWSKKVRAMQTLELGPCLDRVDAYLVPSALGRAEPNASYAFAPLDVETDKERADRFAKQMEAAEKLAGLNAMPEQAFNRGIQSLMISEGYLPELEAALSDIPDDERYGIVADPSPEDMNPDGTKGGDPAISAPGGTSTTPPVAANDASPRPLYVHRKLLNGGELIDWAKAQGFDVTVPADQLHVTVLYSRAAVDPMAMGEGWSSDPDGGLVIKAGGPRALERFGEGAVVLQFASWSLQSRHDEMVRAGASHDYPEYLPHVTLTYQAPEGIDLEAIKPFSGELRFGPEVFEPLDLDWKSKITEE